MEGWMLSRCETILPDIESLQQAFDDTLEIIEIGGTHQLTMPGNVSRTAQSNANRTTFIWLNRDILSRQVATPNFKETQTGSIVLTILLQRLQRITQQRQAQRLHITTQ